MIFWDFLHLRKFGIRLLVPLHCKSNLVSGVHFSVQTFPDFKLYIFVIRSQQSFLWLSSLLPWLHRNLKQTRLSYILRIYHPRCMASRTRTHTRITTADTHRTLFSQFTGKRNSFRTFNNILSKFPRYGVVMIDGR